MRLQHLFGVFALVSLGSTVPAPVPQQRPVEEHPWVVTNIVVFAARDGTNSSSYLSFDFQDTNQGLQLSTCCTLSVPVGKTLISTTTYSNCDNNTVGFRYGGGSLDLKRTYYDPFLGDPPYDHTTAFGTGSTNFRDRTTRTGVYRRMWRLEVPITGLVGR